LLTFFILTFRPAPIEGQVQLRMPPAQPITAGGTQAAGGNTANTNPAKALDTLVITAMAKEDGALGQMAVGETSMGNVMALERKLAQVLGDPTLGFEQVVVQVDSRLRYDGLMAVIDVCTRQKLPNGEVLSKLSFVELPTGGAE
jgi:biopolymer transport protein ExbD